MFRRFGVVGLVLVLMLGLSACGAGGTGGVSVPDSPVTVGEKYSMSYGVSGDDAYKCLVRDTVRDRIMNCEKTYVELIPEDASMIRNFHVEVMEFEGQSFECVWSGRPSGKRSSGACVPVE